MRSLRAFLLEAQERSAEPRRIDQPPFADAHEADPTLPERRQSPPADLQHLAHAGIAAAGKTAARHADERSEAVQPGEADQLSLQPEVAEGDEPEWARGGQPCERRARGCVVGSLRRQPVEVDSEAALVARERGHERTEREITSDEAPAEHAHEHRDSGADARHQEKVAAALPA
jgi:hypothetical protein